MIFVSEYLLSLRDCKALRVTDTYSLHRVVYSLFENVRTGEEGELSGRSSGLIFVDKGAFKGWRRLLMVSDREPLQPEFGTLRWHELKPSFLGWLHYRFECVLNPVRKDAKSGRREPIRGREAVAQWFRKKAPSCGFSLDENSLQVADISVDSFQKDDRRVTLSKARLSGLLTVTDRVLFTHSVAHGIGHGKAFGCGLLQISPLQF